jgi:hypothetical protein
LDWLDGRMSCLVSPPLHEQQHPNDHNRCCYIIRWRQIYCCCLEGMGNMDKFCAMTSRMNPTTTAESGMLFSRNPGMQKSLTPWDFSARVLWINPNLDSLCEEISNLSRRDFS